MNANGRSPQALQPPSGLGPCPGPAPAWRFEVFFDGECPLCLREIRMLQRLDRAGRLRFTDIAAPGFDAAMLGLDHATMMARIHGRLPDGRLVEGVEVFRRLYEAVGFGRIVRLTRLPLVSGFLDACYRLFAKNRLRLTGRCEAGVCQLPREVPATVAR